MGAADEKEEGVDWRGMYSVGTSIGESEVLETCDLEVAAPEVCDGRRSTSVGSSAIDAPHLTQRLTCSAFFSPHLGHFIGHLRRCFEMRAYPRKA
jgi:hypothetical protein